jgi:anaerobic selenocysteine-containing dehydrogenase
MHELIVHDWLDHEYLARHVNGWELLRERALQWPPARTAQVCGLSEQQVRELAQAYGTTRPAAIRLNYGMQRVHGGGNAVRLVALLPCLTGAWRDRGGGMLLSSSGWFASAVDAAALERPDLMPSPRPRIVNMSTIGQDLLRETSPGFGPRIEAVVVYNSNPVAVAPQSASVAAGFAREDLYTVVLEHFMTDTADLADLVLPATTQLEHLDVHRSYGHTWALVNHPAIAPLGEALPNTEIFRRLARRMGFDEPCFADSDEQIARAAFRPEAVDFDELSRTGWVRLRVPERPFAEGGFPTADGRAVVDAPGLGVPDHVPNHESVQSSPQLAERYPLAMISPPARNFLNSTFVNVRSLRAIEGEPLVEVHPDDARARGVADGQVVEVYNDRGRHRCRAVVSTRARPGVVVGLGIWWRKLGLDGTNVNELTSQALTDIGRAPTFYDCLVQVRVVEPAAAGVETGTVVANPA